MNNSNGYENGVGDEGEHDPHFDPIIYLPEVIIDTNEGEEIVMIQLRAKLFRHDKTDKLWKERGTGVAKLLLNETLNTVRVVMRRDKTLKLCANHYVSKDMELKSSCGSDRAWVWSTPADVSDGEPNPEVLAIRFQNAEAALKWKEKFEVAKTIVSDSPLNDDGEKDEGHESGGSEEESDTESTVTDNEVTEEVSKLSISSDQVVSKDEKSELSSEKPISSSTSPK